MRSMDVPVKRQVRLWREGTAGEYKQNLLGCWMLDLGMLELPLRDVQIFCLMHMCLQTDARRTARLTLDSCRGPSSPRPDGKRQNVNHRPWTHADLAMT